MKMTKRILSAVLALVMIVATFSGCSGVETDYLDMLIKLANKSGAYELKSEMVISLNNEVIAALLSSEGDGTVYPADVIPEQIYVTMNGVSDTENMLQFMEIDFNIPSILNFGFDSAITAEATYVGDFYVSSETLDIDALIAETVTTDESLFILYNALLGISDINYIAIPIAEEEGAEMETEDAIAIYETLVEAAKKLFAGFETGVVSKTENGFRIDLTAKEMIDVLRNGIEYLRSNVDAVAEFLVELIDSYRDYMILAYPEITNEDIDLAIAEFVSEESKSELEELLDELAMAFDPVETEEILAELDGSTLSYKISETDNVITVNTDASVAIAGVIFATAEGTSTTTFVEEIAFPELYGYSATLEGLLGYFDSYNMLAESQPLDAMLITWDGTEGAAEVYGTVTDVEMPIALGLYDFHNIGGSMYLPMRRICERLGEVVDWDPVLGRAYVVRGDTKIDMTGVLIDGRTFIKIRDFEKLGYFVDYQVDEDGTPWAILCP